MIQRIDRLEEKLSHRKNEIEEQEYFYVQNKQRSFNHQNDLLEKRLNKLEKENESIVNTNKILTEKVKNQELIIKKLQNTTNTTNIEVLPVDSSDKYEQNLNINRSVDNTNTIQTSYAQGQSARTSGDQTSI